MKRRPQACPWYNKFPTWWQPSHKVFCSLLKWLQFLKLNQLFASGLIKWKIHSAKDAQIGLHLNSMQTHLNWTGFETEILIVWSQTWHTDPQSNTWGMGVKDFGFKKMEIAYAILHMQAGPIRAAKTHHQYMKPKLPHSHNARSLNVLDISLP